MTTLIFVFLLLSLLFFAAAAFNLSGRVNLIAVGLAFMVMSFLVQHFPIH